MYLALGIIFLIACIAIFAMIIATNVLSIKKGGKIITKKNMLYLAPAFLVIYGIHLTAADFNGRQIDFLCCFSMIGTVLEVFKFKTDNDLLLPICRMYHIYYADFIFAALAGAATLILSAASFFSRRITNFVNVKKLLKANCDIILGDSADAVQYQKNTKCSLLLGVNVTRQRYAELIKLGIPVLRVPLEAKALAGKLKNGGYNVIVFRDGNYSYTKVIETFTELINGGVAKLHLEANQHEMKILKEKFITKADGNSKLYVTGFSKYELMARRFVVDHPVTKYIPRSFYNENCTVKNDKDINVVFIGFGKVNYQLFRMCAMQFQLAQEKDGKLASKPVQYYIYDNKDASLHNEFFSRIQFEFDEEFSVCDFPKPEKICDLHICNTDINSVDAKKKFKSLVSENTFTCFIVSLENDLEDASYAQTVKRLLKDSGSYRIFVRAKNNNGEKLNEDGDGIIYFGEEKQLYTHENIINDDLTELAQRINLLYSKIDGAPKWLSDLQEKIEDGLSGEEQRKQLNENLADAKNIEYMQKLWLALPYIEQASNLYHALNLPFKLNLLGFDMVKKSGEEDTGISEDEFNKYYKNSGRSAEYNDYSFYFNTESSNVLAYIEHNRWNALYILYDFKQMKKADMVVEDRVDKEGKSIKFMAHKNLNLKQHACITTYYGLNELLLYKFTSMYPSAVFKNDDENVLNLAKIYEYDYMDLDRLYSEITAMGYKLVKTN